MNIKRWTACVSNDGSWWFEPREGEMPAQDSEMVLASDCDAIAAELASTKEMDKLHDRQAHEYYEELKDAESSIALLSARNAQLEAVLLRHGHKDGSCGLCASLEEAPRVAHSKSEYKRLTALGVECAPPATPNYNVPPWHLSKRVPGCRCDGCLTLEKKDE